MNILKLEPQKVTSGTLGKHFLFYGPPSTYKTTVASNFSKPLLLATEVGYSFIPGVKAIDIETWYQFKEVVNQLKQPEAKAMYDTVIIDTVSLLSDKAEKYILNKFGVTALGDVEWGKGWQSYKKELSETFNYIAQMGYGIVFIAHAKDTRDEHGKVISAAPSLDGSTQTIVNALVDFIFFLNKETDESGKETVYAYSELPSEFITKSRLRGLPRRFEFVYDNVDAVIQKAIAENLGGTKVEIVDKVERVEKVKKPLEELINEIRELAMKASDLGAMDKVENIIRDALGGMPLNEATDFHYDNVQAILQSVSDLVNN